MAQTYVDNLALGMEQGRGCSSSSDSPGDSLMPGPQSEANLGHNHKYLMAQISGS